MSAQSNGSGGPPHRSRATTEVSVVMATYEGARFIRAQLGSLLAQTLPPAELVVADDGSSDDTVRIVTDALESAPFPVRVIVNRERKGYRRNFLEAAGLSRSPLVAFCDQDDLWHPEKLARMAEAFDRPDVLLAYHNARIVDADGAESGSLYGPRGAQVRNESLRTDPWSFSLGFTQIFRSELLQFAPLHARSRDFLFPDERLAHDQWFFFLASALGETCFVDKVLADYRQHETNVFSAVDRGRAHRIHAFRATLDHTPRQLLARFRSAGASAEILSVIAADPDQPVHRRTTAASLSKHYRAIRTLYEARGAAYRRAGLRKARAWLRLIGHRRRLRGIGLSYPLRHAGRDLVFGVVLGRLARG